MYYVPAAYEDARKLWLESKTGALSTIFFGTVAFARLNDSLADSKLWRESYGGNGRDPMGRTKLQPHIEVFTTECYAGLKELSLTPKPDQHVFGIVVELLGPQSFRSVQLTSTDPNATLLVQYIGEKAVDSSSPPIRHGCEVLWYYSLERGISELVDMPVTYRHSKIQSGLLS